MKENDLRMTNPIWLLCFAVFSIGSQFLDGHYSYYFLKHNYYQMLRIDGIELILCIGAIIIPIIYDYFKRKASDLTISKFYMDSQGLDEGVRLCFILDFLSCVYDFLQDLCDLKIINKLEKINLFGLFLIALTLYVRYLSIKIKKIQWNYLAQDKRYVSWDYLIKNNYFDQYKGEVILFKLIKLLNLEDNKLQVSANNYFSFYKRFVGYLQSLSNDRLIELRNYLKIQNREAYKWTVQKILSANLGKIFLSIIISALSFSSIMQLCLNIKRNMILDGLKSVINYFVFFYVLLFLIFYLIRIVIYLLFIPYQRKVRNRNIESFLISAIQTVLDLRKVKQ